MCGDPVDWDAVTVWDEFTLEAINEVCGELLDNPRTLAHGKGPISKATEELKDIITCITHVGRRVFLPCQF